MAFKRRNGGKNRNGRGHVKPVACSNCHRSCPKDKAVKRFQVRNIIETAAQRDMKEASVYKVYQIPKLYLKVAYCISCAIHARVVRPRPANKRRIREPPARIREGDAKPNIGKPLKCLKPSQRKLPVPREPHPEDEERAEKRKAQRAEREAAAAGRVDQQ
jgi:small subunit ribosomal protein S26e